MPKKPLHEKDVLTTGQVCKALLISQQSVIRCCDKGELKSYKVPGSTHRRIQRTAAIEFAVKHNMPHASLLPPVAPTDPVPEASSEATP